MNDIRTCIILYVPEQMTHNFDVLKSIRDQFLELVDTEKVRAYIIGSNEVDYIKPVWFNRPQLVHSQEEFERLNKEFDDIIDSLEEKVEQIEPYNDKD